MILVNSEEIKSVISSMLCSGGAEGPGDPYIAIDEEELRLATEHAEEALAVVQKDGLTLERMAEDACREIDLVMNREAEAVYDFLVAVSSFNDILMSELCIISDILRQAVGERRMRMGLRFVEKPNRESISILICKK